MSIEVTISLEIESFDQLKSVFDAAENARIEAGVTAKLYRNIDVPNNALVIATVASKEVFGAFFFIIGTARTIQSCRSYGTSHNYILGILLKSSRVNWPQNISPHGVRNGDSSI